MVSQYNKQSNMLKEQRMKFRKGEQRRFLDLVIQRLNCVSLRGILQFGFRVKYSSLKSYYIERRLLSKSFFEDLCYLAKIDTHKIRVKVIDGNWGQVKGGKGRK